MWINKDLLVDIMINAIILIGIDRNWSALGIDRGSLFNLTMNN